MRLKSLEELYIDELKDLYSVEKQILRALPKMAKAATAPDLKAAFEEHEKMTQEQKKRLETIFEKMERSPRGKKCKGMEGILEEGEELMEEEAEPEVLDAGLIAAAQRVEHYEMAGYGTARTYARLLGHTDAEKLLQKTLDEEMETDEKLTALAEGGINVEAKESAA